MSSATNQNNLCDYCHQKPKYGNFQYCGRTCSTQAGLLSQSSPICKQCQQKPKFQNFDFCGKKCASIWQATNAGSNTNQFQPSKGFGKHHAANPPPPAGNIHPAQPLQPQSQNKFSKPQWSPPVVPPFNSPAQNPNPPQGAFPPGNMNNSMAPPVVPPVQFQQPQAPVGYPPVPAQNNAGLVSSSTHVCRIPGCGKQVYTAGTSQSSEYCSQRHREEAVTLGLAEPCIMCSKMPRSTTDHFCSKGCRDEALAP